MSQTTKEVINFFLEKNILISPDTISELQKDDLSSCYSEISKKITSNDFLVLGKEIRNLLTEHTNIDISWFDLEKSKALFEKGKNTGIYSKFMSYFDSGELSSSVITKDIVGDDQIKIVSSYEEESKKREVQDFVSFFNARYNSLSVMLNGRPELENITTINRVINKKDRENVSLITIVQSKQTTKNGNLMLKVEDPTGTINVLVNKNKPDLFNLAKEIVLDEVIGVSGVNGDNIIFANNIIWPDIPHNHQLKKHTEDVYAIFLSDLHIGSNTFLSGDFEKFISWINCETGNEQQKEIAKKVKYLFIVGDLVDGCGIYPGQEKELVIKDIYAQYELCASLLRKIPSRIKMIICPGNHDALRIAEPQPKFYDDLSKPLYTLPNATLVSNPAIVNICSSKDFSGFNVLMYHGYSFDYFVANVGELRNNGGYDRADLIMKFLLKRRHLAPSYTSTPYLPDSKQDPLVIQHIPDFFVTGHLHKSIAANYRNITLICGSCWQSKTAFQEKVGHNPQPSRVPMVNLRTRDIKILRFGA